MISYVPLLRPDNRYIDAKDEMTKTLKDLDNVDNFADGLAWTTDNEPVFIMKNAKAIAEHIEEWSEYEVDKWFTLQWYRNEKGYVICLMPNVKMTVDRYKTTYKLLNGVDLPDAKLTVVFKPIIFRCKDTNTFDKVNPTKIRIGFIDPEAVDTSEPHWLSDGDRFYFTYVNDEYMQSLLEDADTEN